MSLSTIQLRRWFAKGLACATTLMVSKTSSIPMDLLQGAAIETMKATWKLNTKNFKDVLIRTYSTFAQIILSPSTTGIKNSVNPNLLEEFSDALKQLDADPECRGKLL